MQETYNYPSESQFLYSIKNKKINRIYSLIRTSVHIPCHPCSGELKRWVGVGWGAVKWRGVSVVPVGWETYLCQSCDSNAGPCFPAGGLLNFHDCRRNPIRPQTLQNFPTGMAEPLHLPIWEWSLVRTEVILRACRVGHCPAVAVHWYVCIIEMWLKARWIT